MLYYHSVKLVRVENPCLVVTYYLLLLAILTYVVVYTVIIEKGYQEYDTLVGSTMIKTKGVAYETISPSPVFTETETLMRHPLPPLASSPVIRISKDTNHLIENRNTLKHAEVQPTATPLDLNNILVYDANDLVIPPLLPDGFFVATTIIETPSQTRGQCVGNDKKMELCNCTEGNCCAAGGLTYNGVKVGTCSTGTFCDLQAWCPLENEKRSVILDQVANWTVMIRVNGDFPMFNTHISNAGTGDLQHGYNLFHISNLINRSGFSWDLIKKKGAIIVLSFNYDCNLNKDISQCQPDISSYRLDNNSSLSTGFNYRHIDKYHVNGTLYRDLTKVYGVRFVVSVKGRGGRFSMSVLSTTFGAGLAFLGIAAVICDIILQYFLPAREKILAKKFEKVAHSSDDLLGDETS